MVVMDRYLDRWDVRTRHQTVVDASASETFDATRHLDIGRSLPVQVLFAIRTVPHLLTGKMPRTRKLTLDTFLKAGFMLLDEEPGRELVIGAVGRFWRPDSGFESIDPDEFGSFDRPGFAKATMNIRVEKQGPTTSLLSTETRVLCTDAAARRRFLLYWRLIEPFSGVIRHMMLRQAKRAAETVAAPDPI